MLDLACFCIRGTTRDSRRGRCPGRTRSDCLARWTQTQVTFERIAFQMTTPLSTRAPRFRVALTPGADDLSVLEQKNAVGQLSRLLLTVGNMQRGDAGLVAD